MSSKKKAFPDKITLNLVISERPPYYYRTLLLSLLFGSCALLVFAKFAVADRFAEAYRAENEARAAQNRYDNLLKENSVYAEVRQVYDQYFRDVADGNDYADVMDVLVILEDTLMKAGGLQSAVLAQNVLSVTLTGINLEQASDIVRALYTIDVVSAVSISSADTTAESTASSVSLNIILNAGNTP